MLPAFIAFDSVAKTYTFTPTISTLVEDYHIALTVGYGPTTGKEHSFDTEFKLNVLENKAPRLKVAQIIGTI